MERLTERTAAGILVKENYEKESLKTLYSCYGEKPNSYYSNREEGYCAMEKLADYEDTEEQSRLIILPCKVGDTVYCIFNRYTRCTFSNEEFDEYSCQGCEYECDSEKENYVQDMRAYSLDWIVTNLKNFGKTVFLTKFEAEAKLKELRGGKNGKIS